MKSLFSIILILYYIELIFGGAGQWSYYYFGVNIRKTIFLIVAIYLLYVYLKNSKIKNIDVTVLIAGLYFIGIGLILSPIYFGTNFVYVIPDATPHISILLITWIYLNTQENSYFNFEKIIYWVYLLIFIFACLHLTIFLLLSIFPDIGFQYVEIVKIALDPTGLENVYIGIMDNGMPRVFIVSSIFLVYGLYKSCINIYNSFSYIKLIFTSIFFAAILSTQVRAIVLSVPIGIFIGYIILLLISNFKLGKSVTSLIVALSFIVISFMTISLFSPEILEFFGVDREGSDLERVSQIPHLLHAILDNWFIGVGFGGNAGYIRSDVAPYGYEMAILATFMKLGIVGSIYLLIYIYYFISKITPNFQIICGNKFIFNAFYCLGFTYWFSFNTNPYLFNAVGLSVLLLILIESSILKRRHEIITQ